MKLNHTTYKDLGNFFEDGPVGQIRNPKQELYIQSPTGLVPILGYIEKPPTDIVRVELENGEFFDASSGHIFVCNGVNTTVDDLQEIGGVGVLEKTVIGKEPVYDISIPSPHHYKHKEESAFVHHNTHSVEKTLKELGLKDGEGMFKITGSASASGIYSMLFKHRKDVILFDDADGALADQDSRNLIKAATDTVKVRKLVWMKKAKNLMDPNVITDADIEDGFIPTHFEFEGKVIFISNLSINKLDPDGALRTRALMIAIDPTDEEVLNFMKKICLTMDLEDGLKLDDTKRLEVVDLIGQGESASLNLRKLVRGLNIRAGLETAGGDTNWQRLIKLYA